MLRRRISVGLPTAAFQDRISPGADGLFNLAAALVDRGDRQRAAQLFAPPTLPSSRGRSGSSAPEPAKLAPSHLVDRLSEKTLISEIPVTEGTGQFDDMGAEIRRPVLGPDGKPVVRRQATAVPVHPAVAAWRLRQAGIDPTTLREDPGAAARALEALQNLEQVHAVLDFQREQGGQVDPRVEALREEMLRQARETMAGAGRGAAQVLGGLPQLFAEQLPAIAGPEEAPASGSGGSIADLFTERAPRSGPSAPETDEQRMRARLALSRQPDRRGEQARQAEDDPVSLMRVWNQMQDDQAKRELRVDPRTGGLAVRGGASLFDIDQLLAEAQGQRPSVDLAGFEQEAPEVQQVLAGDPATAAQFRAILAAGDPERIAKARARLQEAGLAAAR